VCLERTIELDAVRLAVRDWPGVGGPLVHVPDLLLPSTLVEGLALALAPTCRVLSVAPRINVAYQVAAMDLADVLRQFGFPRPVLLGEGLGCLHVLIVAAWYPELVWRVVLVDPTSVPSAGDSLETRALRNCPPDMTSLRRAVKCDVLELASDDAALGQRIEAFTTAPLP
jgi:pimeloyl-ACP methyl ester carboxylesterase